MTDLTAAIDAAAAAWFDRTQTGRKDDGARYTFADLTETDQRAFRALAEPVVMAAVPHIREAIAGDIDDFEPPDLFLRHSADWKDALDWAADIARGGTS